MTTSQARRERVAALIQEWLAQPDYARSDYSTLLERILTFAAQEVEQASAQARGALEESVKLQGHYAEALNMYDGGYRIVFKDAEDWIARLAMTLEERVKDAALRAASSGDNDAVDFH